jgi:hypothetical protein
MKLVGGTLLLAEMGTLLAGRNTWVWCGVLRRSFRTLFQLHLTSLNLFFPFCLLWREDCANCGPDDVVQTDEDACLLRAHPWARPASLLAWLIRQDPKTRQGNLRSEPRRYFR